MTSAMGFNSAPLESGDFPPNSQQELVGVTILGESNSTATCNQHGDLTTAHGMHSYPQIMTSAMENDRTALESGDFSPNSKEELVGVFSHHPGRK
jgi:hypothetical protein